MKRSLIAAILVASASFGSSAVMAQSVVGNSPQALDLTDLSAYFGDAFAEGNAGNTFADRFTFTVDSAIGLNLNAIVGSPNIGGADLDITSMGLYDGSDNLLTAGTDFSGPYELWTLASTNLASGDYYLQVSGSLVSDSSSAFGGAVMLAPVPEPGIYGMLLGGLGVLGLVKRRRKAKPE